MTVAGQTVALWADDPTRRAVADRCTARGVTGAVACVAPIAAQAGADALRAGGNAFDAAVAAALAETVLQPPKCGLAGDLVAMCRSTEGELQALVSIGGAGAGLADSVRRDGPLPMTGGRAAGVPGAAAGYAALAALGRLGLARLAEPAYDLAVNGFVWSRVVDVLTHESLDLLRRENPQGCVYLPDGDPPRRGQVMRLPGMARLLEMFADHGSDLFQGPAGRALCNEVERHGGVLTENDLAVDPVRWATAASRRLGGHRLHVTPNPTHGPSLLEALTALPAGADAATLYSTVVDAAAERARVLGDSPAGGGTSVVAAADAAGNAAVVVHSNSFPQYGSGIVVTDYDLVVSNRAGRGFSSDPDHPNFPHPGRRPATTLHAWALQPATPGETLLGATHGGENQMPWNAQLLAHLLAGVPPAEAVLAPLWRIGDAPDVLSVETDLPAEDKDRLRRAGASLTEVPQWSLRSGYQIVSVDGESPAAVSDLRTIGAAVAW